MIGDFNLLIAISVSSYEAQPNINKKHKVEKVVCCDPLWRVSHYKGQSIWHNECRQKQDKHHVHIPHDFELIVLCNNAFWSFGNTCFLKRPRKVLKFRLLLFLLFFLDGLLGVIFQDSLRECLWNHCFFWVGWWLLRLVWFRAFTSTFWARFLLWLFGDSTIRDPRNLCVVESKERSSKLWRFGGISNRCNSFWSYRYGRGLSFFFKTLLKFIFGTLLKIWYLNLRVLIGQKGLPVHSQCLMKA